MSDEQLVFEGTIDGLLRALKGRLSPRALERLAALGIVPDAKLRPAYPLATWMQALDVAREECFGELPAEQGFRELGRAFIEGYRQTMLGGAVMSMARLLGVKRSLARMTQNFRSGTNYSQTLLTELGPTRFDLWINEVGHCPEFTAGLMFGGLESVGAKNLRITVHDHDGHQAIYLVEWDP